jgi:hypothetical protein
LDPLGMENSGIEIKSGDTITYLKKLNTGQPVEILERFCGYFISKELHKSFYFYHRNGRLTCDSFLDCGQVDFYYLYHDRFGFIHGFLDFQHQKDGKITGFRLKRQDLGGYFGSFFVKNIP